MLRAKDEGVVSEIEIHVEGGTQDRRFKDEIYKRGLTPEKLDAALQQSEGHGFKVPCVVGSRGCSRSWGRRSTSASLGRGSVASATAEKRL